MDISPLESHLKPQQMYSEQGLNSCGVATEISRLFMCINVSVRQPLLVRDVTSVLFVFGWKEQKIPLHWLKQVRSLFGPHPVTTGRKFTGIFQGPVSFHLPPLWPSSSVTFVRVSCGCCCYRHHAQDPSRKERQGLVFSVGRETLLRGVLPWTHWLQMCDMEEKGKEAWGVEGGPNPQFLSLCDYEYCWAFSSRA